MRDARRADTAATGVAGLQPLAEGFAVHLADGGEGEVVEDVDLARVLVGGQAGARELDQLIGAGARPRPERHERDHLLAMERVRPADDPRHRDGRVRYQRLLDVPAEDVAAPAEVQVILAGADAI